MKHIYSILLLMLVIAIRAVCQTPDENLDKYWKYRDRLRKDFLKIGDDHGESIPMSARSIGFAYGTPMAHSVSITFPFIEGGKKTTSKKSKSPFLKYFSFYF